MEIGSTPDPSESEETPPPPPVPVPVPSEMPPPQADTPHTSVTSPPADVPPIKALHADTGDAAPSPSTLQPDIWAQRTIAIAIHLLPDDVGGAERRAVIGVRNDTDVPLLRTTTVPREGDMWEKLTPMLDALLDALRTELPEREARRLARVQTTPPSVPPPSRGKTGKGATPHPAAPAAASAPPVPVPLPDGGSSTGQMNQMSLF